MDNIIEILKLKCHQFQTTSSAEAIFLVHREWVDEICSTGKVPEHHFMPEADQCMEHLYPSTPPPASPWLRLTFQMTSIHEGFIILHIPTSSRMINGLSEDYSSVMAYVNKQNRINLCEAANRKYGRKAHTKTTVRTHEEFLVEAISHLYGVTPVKSNLAVNYAIYVPTKHNHSVILQPVFVVKTPSMLCVVYPYTEFTLHDAILFSPSMFSSSSAKALFVIFQLLRLLQSCHAGGFTVGDLCAHDVSLSPSMCVQVKIPKLFSNPRVVVKPKTETQCSTDINLINIPLPELTQKWESGKITNFDYLMSLNSLAGRRMGDPNLHPVLPWVIDFTSADGGWRDLSKTKYRLNKGDRQLDLTYESLMHTQLAIGYTDQAISTLPHHITDFLSDITYYMYKARQTSVDLLCKHVRTKWVPHEYPASLQRIFEWTPDECIPEFFTDPNIFSSIHDDLPDLDVPSWCTGVEDFIRHHRAALESESVSRKLHYWIDLVFGYKGWGGNFYTDLVGLIPNLQTKTEAPLDEFVELRRMLTGVAAVKSKNVCLHLVQQDTSLRNCGIVQLFTEPHPQKFIDEPPVSFWLQQELDSAEDSLISAKHMETVNEQSRVTSSASELTESKVNNGSSWDFVEIAESDAVLTVPVIANPLQELEEIEKKCAFLTKLDVDAKMIHLQPGHVSQPDNARAATWWCSDKEKLRDMQSLGCLIAELFLGAKPKSAGEKPNLADRHSIIKNHYHMDHSIFPRFIREGLDTLLQLSKNSEKQVDDEPGEASLVFEYEPVSSRGLPPPTPAHLLHPVFAVFPFPKYFDELYSVMHDYNAFKQMNFQILPDDARNTCTRIVKLLPQLDEEGIAFLMPLITLLMGQSSTSVGAIWLMFNPVGEILGPQDTARQLLPFLIRLYNTEDTTAKHVKFYHQTFLLKLIVRLGLQTFLSNFSTLIVEAVSSYKDYDPMEQMGTPAGTLRRPAPAHLKPVEKLVGTEEVGGEKQHEVMNIADQIPEVGESEHIKKILRETSPEKADDIVVPSAGEDVTVDAAECCNAAISDNKDNLESGTMNVDDAVCFSVPQLDGAIESDADREHDHESIETDEEAPTEEVVAAVPLDDIQTDEIFEFDHETEVELNTDIAQKDENALEVSNVEKAEADSSVLSRSHVTEYNISHAATDSVLWLSHRLGPMLTGKYLTRNLLKMLTLCYIGEEQLQFSNLPGVFKCQDEVCIGRIALIGDINASKIIDSLTNIASLYGEHFILLQYLPYVRDLVKAGGKRISAGTEAALIAAMVLFRHIVPFLSDIKIMDNLQELFVHEILLPTVRILSSVSLRFPNGGHARRVLCYKFLDTVYIIALRIGFEMTRRYLTSLLQRFFLSFDTAHRDKPADSQNGKPVSRERPTESSKLSHHLQDSEQANADGALNAVLSPAETADILDEEAVQQVAYVFDSEMAHQAYIPFCRLAGGLHMEHNLPNDDLIRKMIEAHDCRLLTSNILEPPGEVVKVEPEQGGQDVAVQTSLHESVSSCDDGSGFGKNVAVTGNRIDIQASGPSETTPSQQYLSEAKTPRRFPSVSDIPSLDADMLVSSKMGNKQRHLKGNWMAYWEHEVGRSEKDQRFSFKQIKLQTFTGHGSSVRSIAALDNENSFMSASKDRTVKLWSLRSQGDGGARSQCQWTYTGHRKSVLSVAFLESLRLVASCDSNVHIWDPFMGYCLQQFDAPAYTPVTAMVSMPPPSQLFIVGTTDATIRFLDCRLQQYIHEFKVSTGPAGFIRSITVGPGNHWVAIGLTSGVVSMLDVRTGFLIGTYKGHDNDILQVKAFNSNTFVTTSLDHRVCLWNADLCQPRCTLRGSQEPVHLIGFYKNDMISGTTDNRIGVNTNVLSHATYSAVRLRSDVFRGVLTAMTVLPLNRLLLLGADNGTIRLLY